MNVAMLVLLLGLIALVLVQHRSSRVLRESERRYRHIFESAGVSLWEVDFSRVKAAVDEVKAKGASDFRQYLREHPEFVERTNQMLGFRGINETTVQMFQAKDKQELLSSMGKIFPPKAEEAFVGQLIAIAEGRESFETRMDLKTLKGEEMKALFRVVFADFNSAVLSIVDVTKT